jgi:hypothetical protein
MRIREVIKLTSTPVIGNNNIERFVADLNTQDYIIYLPLFHGSKAWIVLFYLTVLISRRQALTWFVPQVERLELIGQVDYGFILPSACRNSSGSSITGRLSDPFI